MKKFMCAVFSLVAALCLLCGCGGGATKETRPDVPARVSEQAIDENLRAFLGVSDTKPNGDVGNRTPTSESERAAAQRLYDRYATYRNVRVTMIEDTTFEVKLNNETRTSQNVEVRFAVGEHTQKQVIVSAGYDSAYGDYTAKHTAESASGAFANGTGVATVMSLIDYCEQNAESLRAQIDFDIVFVFFGCSYLNSYGATKYLSDTMTVLQKQNTMLMINIDKLGGDRTYLYTGEEAKDNRAFLRTVASEQGLTYYDLPDNMPIIEGRYLNDLYYTHFAMLGDHAPFIDLGVPVAYLFSGYYGGFNLSDLERKGKANLGGTANDTYLRLVQERSAYAAQGSDAAALVLSALTKEGFADAMASARASGRDMSFWANPLWAYLIVLGLIIVLAVILIILVKVTEKKHPFVPTVKRMKIAVFGMEYEDPQEGDVFIDMKKRGGGDNPFDGY